MGSEEHEHRVEKLVKDGEREAQSLEQDADKLGERIDETRRDWERRRRDRAEPGTSETDDKPADEGGEHSAEPAE
jgi:hypothetical protein